MKQNHPSPFPNGGNPHLSILPLAESYASKTDWEEAGWRAMLKHPKSWQSLLTRKERHVLIMRLAAQEKLADGKSYRQISEELWLSPQTISTIKKAMNENSYRGYTERSKKERKQRKISYTPTPSRRQHAGRAVRTKYGTVYIPG